MSANGRTRNVRCKMTDLEAYDLLPPAIRHAMQEGPQGWDACWAVYHFRRLRRRHGEVKAIVAMVLSIERAHRIEIARAIPWQPKGKRRGADPVPSPHLMAGATMQTSGRGNGECRVMPRIPARLHHLTVATYTGA